MKFLFAILFFVILSGPNAAGQDASTDSLKKLLEKAPPDSNRLKLLFQIADTYYFSLPDSCLVYSLPALRLARDLRMKDAEIIALNYSGEAYRFLGDFPGALNMQFEALKLSRKIKNKTREAASLGYIGFTYTELGEYRLGLQSLLLSSLIHRELSNQIMYTFNLTNIGNAYDLLGMTDSALFYQQKAIISYTGLEHGPLESLTLTRLGNAYASKGMLDSAMSTYYLAMENCYRVNDKVNISKVQNKIARIYAQGKKYDSSIYYALLAFANGNLSNQRLEVLESSTLLSSLYRDPFHKPDSALFYQDRAMAMKDTMYGQGKFQQLQRLMLGEQQQQQQLAQDQQQYKNKIRYIILFIIIGVFLLMSFLLFRNSRLQGKAKLKIQAAYNELKDTQEQLVQKEKMASLGELTAGIAHEIQNPLNFVNNFAEVNMELIDELQQDLQAGKMEQVNAITNDIKDNELKIAHHGKRADAIVKSMLQHSRTNSTGKEPTDINALCDEYLRLSYHGLRARDKSFNATIKKDLDPTVGKVNVLPQDLGRVILNLLNNAFYAVQQKQAALTTVPYEPTVTVCTKKIGGRVEISVADNGNGIPSTVLEKIFHPFFTTKPSGQGTGLGLSLSYDIITKGHGGEIRVNTKENEGTEFIIVVPV